MSASYGCHVQVVAMIGRNTGARSSRRVAAVATRIVLGALSRIASQPKPSSRQYLRWNLGRSGINMVRTKKTCPKEIVTGAKSEVPWKTTNTYLLLCVLCSATEIL